MSLWSVHDPIADKDHAAAKSLEKEAIGEFIEFRQLKANKSKATDLDNTEVADIAINDDVQTDEDYTSRLNRLVQLTGSSVSPFDPG